MSLDNFISFYNLDEKDTINIFKRINRIIECFYNQEEKTLNLVDLKEIEHIQFSLESKYSLLTTLHTIKIIVLLLKYYEPCSSLLEKYEDIENDYLTYYENSDNISKITKGELDNFLNIKMVEFMTKTTSYTKTRNLLLMALLSQYPLKLNELVDIKYVCYEGATPKDTLGSNVAILKKDCEFYFIRNGKTILEQTVKQINYLPLHRLLSHYLAKFKRGKSLFCGINGSALSKSNISNGLINFTRSELGYAISIHDIRSLHFTS